MYRVFRYSEEDNYWETGKIPETPVTIVEQQNKVTKQDSEPFNPISKCDNISYQLEYLDDIDNGYLVHYWVEPSQDYVMSFVYDDALDELVVIRLENIDRVPYENFGEAYDYFDKLSLDLLEICRIDNLDI